MISIILIEPEHPGNIGAIARIMKNFALTDLVLIEPQIDHLQDEAIARSKHAKDILADAKVMKKKDLKSFDLLVGTTAKLGSDYNLTRVPLCPRQFSEQIKDKKANIGIVFGREGKGMTNAELRMCDFIIYIPANPDYPVLNVSHACSIICYEIFRSTKQSKKNYKLPTREEKDAILKDIDSVLDTFTFATEDMKTTQKRFWKKIISKTFITKREAYILFGFFKHLKKKIQVK